MTFRSTQRVTPRYSLSRLRERARERAVEALSGGFFLFPLPDMERPHKRKVRGAHFHGLEAGAEGTAVEAAISTVDQSDIRGSS
jgi:hypothetical protein